MPAPASAPAKPLDALQSAALRRACEIAADRYIEPLTLVDLAAAAQLPVGALNRCFLHYYGVTPMRWLWAFRTLLAAELIATHPEVTLQLVSRLCGFTSQAHFSRRFRSLFQQTASDFREHFARSQAAGEITALYGRPADATLANLTQITLAKLTQTSRHWLRPLRSAKAKPASPSTRRRI